MTKRRIVDDHDEEEDQVESVPETYLVEVITKARVIEDKQFEYRVKWAGYQSEDDTWEPYRNVQECKRLLVSFWDHVGRANRRHPGPIGTVYSAKSAWIEAEKEFFRTSFEREQKQSQAETKSSLASASTSNDPRDLFSDDESDEEPLMAKINLKSSRPKPTHFKKSTAPSEIRHNPKPQQQHIFEKAIKSKFAGLKIRKKSESDPSAIRTGQEALASSSLTRSPQIAPTSAQVGQDVQSSRQPSSSTPVLDSAPSGFGPSYLLSTTTVQHKVRGTADDVDNLLATIAPISAVMAQKKETIDLAGFDNDAMDVDEPGKILSGNKWMWEGELFLDSVGGSSAHFCDVLITDSSAGEPPGFRLESLLDQKDSIRFNKTYGLFEINVILDSLRRVDEFAILSAREQKDVSRLKAFSMYLREKQQIACSAIQTDFGNLAQLLVYPTSLARLNVRLKSPIDTRDDTSLSVALLPWKITPSKYKSKGFQKPPDTRYIALEPVVNEWASIVKRRTYSAAARMSLKFLSFDKWLAGFLPGRSYCIWSHPVEPLPNDSGKKFDRSNARPETKALLRILDENGAKNVGYKANKRLIFVHVGALATINNLPCIVEWRSKRLDAHFFTYGFHESVHISRWGVHEVYPLGGIVTFTYRALLDEPYHTALLIERLHSHTLWSGYVLPSVLSVFIRRASVGDDPLTEYSRDPGQFGRILDLIHDRKLSLTSCPPRACGFVQQEELEEPTIWLEEQLSMIHKTKEDIIEDCWRLYVSRFVNAEDREIIAALESDITTDLSRLQGESSIYQNYRRFVVIKSVRDDHIPSEFKGFEWLTVNEFDFQDQFFEGK